MGRQIEGKKISIDEHICTLLYSMGPKFISFTLSCSVYQINTFLYLLQNSEIATKIGGNQRFLHMHTFLYLFLLRTIAKLKQILG